MHRAPAWVGTIGTTLYLVRASSAAVAREKVAETAQKRCRQPGLFFLPGEVSVRRARPEDLLLFAEVGGVTAEQGALVA